MKDSIILTENELKDLIKSVRTEVININEHINMLFESSWSRVLQWMDNYDIATITAFRSQLKNIRNPQKTFIPKGMNVGDSFSLKQNRDKNLRLKAQLIAKGYGVTSIHGSYIEGIGGNNNSEVAEESFFVVNINNNPNFEETMFNLSEYYNQDSFLIKPKGKHALLIGTNNTDFPGYGNAVDQGELTSLPSKFMSRIKNACFAFVNKDKWIIKNKKEDLTAQDMDDYEHSFSWYDDQESDYAHRKQKRIKQNLNESRFDYKNRMSKLANEWIAINEHNGIFLDTIDNYKGFAKQSLFAIANGKLL